MLSFFCRLFFFEGESIEDLRIYIENNIKDLSPQCGLSYRAILHNTRMAHNLRTQAMKKKIIFAISNGLDLPEM